MKPTPPFWQKLSAKQVGAGVITAVLFIGVVVLLTPVLPLGIDWRDTYRPATWAILQGHNPYDPNLSPEAPFVAAPWSLLFLVPLAFLPLETGRAALFLLSILAFAYTAKRLGATPFTMLFFLMAPPVIHCLLNANIEWMPLLGFVLPPQIGLFFLTTKPQTAFAVGIFWLVQAWQEGGWRSVLRTFTPIGVAYLASFVLFGLWPLRSFQVVGIANDFNSSLWPYSIPVGLGLLAASIYYRRAEYAMPASPCLSPYVLFHSWSSAVVAMVRSPLAIFTTVGLLWVVVIGRLLTGS